MRKLLAEAIGTFWLVLGGCGAALVAAGVPNVGIGYAGVSLAFGLTVLTMAVAIGHISGCHLNPAVTAGLAASGRFPTKDVLGYVVAAKWFSSIGAAFVWCIVAWFHHHYVVKLPPERRTLKGQWFLADSWLDI